VTPFRSDHKVLIVAPDALLAALIGVLVETARLQAAFPEPGEAMDDALSRVRPLAAVLLDAMAEDAGSDVFLARAKRAGVPVFMFGPMSRVERHRSWAASHDIATFVLPRDTRELSAALERLAQPLQPRGAERRTPRVERNGNGELVLDDGNGHRWTVFDRRSGDRRAAQVEREFVRDDGQIRRCLLTAQEAQSTDAVDLSRQLAGAHAPD
jgi:hypothetical protein